MLVMIDHLAERGPCPGAFFERLQRFRFYMLDMDALGLSDDLYIKMNGRGLALTPFENFKAELTRHLPFNSEQVGEFTLWLDHSFLEFFWSESDVAKKQLPDSLMLEFINRYAIVRKILVTETKAEEGGKIIDAFPAEYNSFTPYEFDIDWMLFRKVFSFMAEDREEQSWQPSWERSKGEYVLPSYRREERGAISPTGRCIFAAICIFVTKKPNDTCNSPLFKQWMRICWNVVENTSGMVSRIKLLKRLADKLLTENTSVDLYGYIGEMIKGNKLRPEDIVDGNASEQLRVLREEFEKAAEYRNYSTIIEAEKSFKGSIFFLFASDYNESTGYSLRWSDFLDKWDTLQGENGLLCSFREKDTSSQKKLWSHFCFELVKHVQPGKWEICEALYGNQIFDYTRGSIEKEILTNVALLPAIHAMLTDKACLSDQDDGKRAEEDYPPYNSALCHRELIEYAVENEKEARLHWYTGHVCLYKPSTKWEGIVLGQKAASRADSLIMLIKEGKVSLGEWNEWRRHDGLTSYLRGWNIPFKVGDVHYMWTSSSTIRLDGDWSSDKAEVRFTHDRYREIELKVESSILGVIQPLLEDVGWVRECSASTSNTSQS